MDIAPSDIQKTLAARAPLIRLICVPTPTVNAPSNLSMKYASESFCPSRVIVPLKEPAPGVE